jgi:Zn-dependent peptidase ImmA (M78 family)
MISVKETLYQQQPDIFKDIESKAILQIQELNAGQRVQDDIFRIIKNIPGLQIIKFPVEDENLTAFTIHKKDIFMFINTNLPLEKQIFGAAHELYHVLFGDNNAAKEEVLKDIEKPFNGNIDEMKANSFAACFLVPKHQLEQAIYSLKIDVKNIESIDVIKLMDVFAVPFKAMILRLHEIGVLETTDAERFLAIPDREPKKGVMLLINQTRHAKRWQEATNEHEYGNFIEVATKNYTENMISFEQLQEDFNKIITDEKVEAYLEE